MATTLDTITDEQIKALSRGAAEAGDMVQVTICRAALAGVSDARRVCVAAINDAEAMGDETRRDAYPAGSR